MPQSGELTETVRVRRRATAANVGGVVKAAGWTDLIARRTVKLRPTRSGGGEVVTAGRLTGQTPWDCWFIGDPETATITAGDMVEQIVVDAAGAYVSTLRQFAVTAPPIDMDGRGHWLFVQLQEGVAHG